MHSMPAVAHHGGLSYDRLMEILEEKGESSIPPYDLVSVPGAVDGWFEMHQRFGSMPMENILEGFDLASKGFASEETLHLLIEAKKLAYEDRAKHYTDTDFYNIPYETLLSKEYASERLMLIGDRAMNDLSTGVDVMNDGDTIYLTTADSHGNMVSLIQSNFRGFEGMVKKLRN
jgi:gamma-glutamyltranspeptidase